MSSLIKASIELPCSVAFVSVDAEGKQDAMTASAMYTSMNPPLIAISVAKHLISRDLIDKAREFVVNVASTKLIDLAQKLGATHGKDVDKFKEFHILTEPASKVKSPLIKDCFAHVECKVRDSFIVGDYVIYIGEVVAYKRREDLEPLTWFDNRYFELGREIV